MCGIVGLFTRGEVNQTLYDAMITLQHRGQDAAGMATYDGRRLNIHKGKGLVRDVFDMTDMMRLSGNIGIGHLRYPTAGTYDPALAQPFYVNSPYGMTLAHNGNLTNTEQLTQEVVLNDLRYLNTNSDSEVLLNVFAYELQKTGGQALSTDQLCQAIKRVAQRCSGGYAVVSLIAGFGLVGFRDPYGIRPLIVGQRKSASGMEYMIASESVALSCLGFEVLSDVQPGEAVFITLQGELIRQQCIEKVALSPCLFEYVYLARPDSIIDKISVYKVRLKLGEYLAQQIKQQYPNHDIDVVIPIPESSMTAGHSLALTLGVKYRAGFVKNRYVGRTFIMPGQQLRRRSVKQKLNTIDLEFENKNVLLVDDSIVRGTTSKEIIQMARHAGAKKVYFASAAPAVRYQNVYGINMPTQRDLIASGRTVEQVAKEIGADWLIYLELESLIKAVQEGNADIKRFEDSVFTGDYITGDVNEAYLKDLASRNIESNS